MEISKLKFYLKLFFISSIIFNVVLKHLLLFQTPGPGPEHLSSIQRGAVIQAQASFGYFIPQDSLFGNVILPVLPRFDNK